MKLHIKIIRVENGWIVQTGEPYSGTEASSYVAATPDEVIGVVGSLATEFCTDFRHSLDKAAC